MVDMFSLKDRHKPSTTTKSTTTSFDYTLLPKKIIKATNSYLAQHEHELSFEKGDFFHVVGRENDRHWYAVNNPLSNVHGLVPVSYFQDVDKSTRTMNAIQPTLPLDYQQEQQHYYHHHQQQLDTSTKRSSARPQSHQQRCYGIVLYDFVAERQDELGCKADETIIVIAQSNKEWYVAKPIGRLGGPGLIPVSFVQLYDVITNHPVLLPTTGHAPPSSAIPKLDEWKKQTQLYEDSSIPLSATNYSKNTPSYYTKPDRHSGGGLSLSSNSSSLSDQQQPQQQQQQPYKRYSSPSRRHDRRHHSTSSSSSSSSSFSSPSPALFHSPQRHSYESSGPLSRHDNEMTSRTHQHSNLRHSQQVQSQQQQQQQQPSLPSSARRSSIYNPSTHQKAQVVDITANSFILEGDQYWFVFYATVSNGKHRILYRTYECFYQFHVRLLQKYPIEAGQGDKERILPMMPAPLEQVDDLITEQRREDLDDYCKKLLMLPPYLSGSDLIQTDLFGLKKGDVETDYALKKGSRVIKSTNLQPPPATTVTQDVHQPRQYENRISMATVKDTHHGLGTTTAAAAANYGGAIGLVKIKIIYKDDIFAVKISADCTMQELRQRIKDRLGGGTLGTMTYKNDTQQHNGAYLPLDTEMDMEEAFILAIQHGKLTIAVDS